MGLEGVGITGFAYLSLNLYVGIVLGFFVTLMLVSVLNRFGDAMFRRGFAKPFYIRGHRLHHRPILHVAVPVAYTSLALLVVFGFVRIVWRLLWTGLATTVVIAAACLTLDLLWDQRSSWGARWGVLHHELIYLAIPAFAFTDFLKLVV